MAALALTKASPVVFAIEGVAPMGEVTLFTGPGGGGKSLLAHQLCTVGAAALGACLGLAVTPGPTIYVTCEDAAEHLHFRQERLCEALGVPMASLAGQLHIVSLRGEAVEAEEPGDDDDIEEAGDLITQIMDMPAPDASAVRWKLDHILAEPGGPASYTPDYVKQLIVDYRRFLGEA